MNPNETNPTTPTGASGGAGGASGATSSPIPAPLDLTGTSSSGLSMADSLASAQDNLTSAGQAANLTSNTLGVDQLGADSPSASMEMPNQPLTPAAPVPGSIGSVTSVPPLKSADNTSSFGSTTPTTSAMPVMGGASTTNSATSAPTTATNSSYYNPFATPSSTASATNTATTSATSSMNSMSNLNSATMPTSSTAVPPALQPQTEKFSDRLKTPKPAQGGSNAKGILMIIGWALALVATILAVFFFVQWQGAEKRANEKEIVYVPAPEPDGGDDVVSTITCKQDLGGEGTEGLENAVNHSRTAIINYFNEDENHNLNFVMLTDDYSFTDNAAAEAARGRFDEQAAGLAGIAEGVGVAPLESNIEVMDNVLHYTVSGAADRLIGEHANMLLVPIGEDGVVLTDPENLQKSYEDHGFACVAE